MKKRLRGENNMNYYALGTFCGILLAAAIFAVIVLVTKGSGSHSSVFSFDFDERQQTARARAFKWAFITLAVYLVLDGIAEMALGRPWSDRLTGSTIGIILALTVFAVLCVKHDAYFALSEKPKSVLILVGAAAVMNVVAAVGNLLSGNPYIEDGMLSIRVVNPVCAVMLLVVLAAVVIKRSHAGEADSE